VSKLWSILGEKITTEGALLTGLAQINDASSVEPATKLRYDLQYVREQSLAYDVKIVSRQIWKVVEDVWKTVLGRDEESEESRDAEESISASSRRCRRQRKNCFCC